ncbi:MAG TPA: 5-(carboxyamino)imidazole ribonucleotide mutase [Candidatus Paceibacterota bacterium]|nr:5-(carboxyamino)imidazole ribonucleotide mutase [Candidatus Paceibacterota bacterium]
MKKPMVGIIMGSDSDLPVMAEAAKALEGFGVAYEISVVSAHRTPDKLFAYANGAEGRGIKVIIAGAGGAAHLPGMTASMTALPVIGVPVKTKTMDGLDSLLSIAQMPPGVPVATVAVNGAKNAGILAAEILGLADKKLREKISDYKKKMNKEVKVKSAKLARLGYKKYLK